MTPGFLDKLIARLDKLDPGEVQAYVMRLVREKGFFEKVFEALQEGVIVTDAEGRVSFVNTAAAGFFGIAPEAWTGESVERHLRGVSWQELVAGEGVVSRDLEITYPDQRFVNFYVSPVDPDSDLGHVMLIRDITGSRAAAAATIESEQLNALTLLAAGVAHELGNPLNSLGIHLQLLERKIDKRHPELKDTVAPVMEIARGEIQRLSLIIEQFLGAIRPQPPKLELVQLNDLAQAAVRVMEAELADRQIRVTQELHSALPLLQLDPGQIKQALFNLLRNASQAMNPGGELLVRTEFNDYEVTLTVRDDGAGMSAETMSHAFDPYFSTKSRGTGLGLLIVRRIVRDHGGEIGIQSRQGKGTRVTMHLPRFQRAVRLLEAGDGEPASASGPDLEAGATATEVSVSSGGNEEAVDGREPGGSSRAHAGGAGAAGRPRSRSRRP